MTIPSTLYYSLFSVQLQAIGVLKRDIRRETLRIEQETKPIVEGVPSVEESTKRPSPVHDALTGMKVDAEGVIHIDSDTDDGYPLIHNERSSLTSNNPPSGSSGTNPQSSPSGDVIIDLTGDTSTLSPTQLNPQPFPLSQSQSQSQSQAQKKKRSVSLRLDLSSETLRGVGVGMPSSMFGHQPPSPVTLAPRTARILEQPQSAIPGMSQEDLIPQLLSAIAAQSQSQTQTQHDIMSRGNPGVGVGGNGGVGTSSEVIDLTLDPNDQMDLDLFGEIVDDDDGNSGRDADADADAEGDSDMREVENLFSQSMADNSPHGNDHTNNSTQNGGGDAMLSHHPQNPISSDDPSSLFNAQSDSQLSQLSQLSQSTLDANGAPANDNTTADLLASLTNFTNATSGTSSESILATSDNSTRDLFDNLDTSISSMASIPLSDSQPQSQSLGAPSEAQQTLDLSSMDIDFSTLPLNSDFFSSNVGGLDGNGSDGDAGIGGLMEDVELQLQRIDVIDFSTMLDSLGQSHPQT